MVSARQPNTHGAAMPQTLYPTDWMTTLRLTVKHLCDQGDAPDDVRYVGALLYKTFDHVEMVTIGEQAKKVTHNHRKNAKEMLVSLLRWMPHAKTPDGSVWKSVDDFQNEECLNEADVTSGKRLLKACGFMEVYQLQKGEAYSWNRSTHYRINPPAFIRRIAQVLGINELDLHKLLISFSAKNQGYASPQNQGHGADEKAGDVYPEKAPDPFPKNPVQASGEKQGDESSPLPSPLPSSLPSPLASPPPSNAAAGHSTDALGQEKSESQKALIKFGVSEKKAETLKDVPVAMVRWLIDKKLPERKRDSPKGWVAWACGDASMQQEFEQWQFDQSPERYTSGMEEFFDTDTEIAGVNEWRQSRTFGRWARVNIRFAIGQVIVQRWLVKLRLDRVARRIARRNQRLLAKRAAMARIEREQRRIEAERRRESAYRVWMQQHGITALECVEDAQYDFGTLLMRWGNPRKGSREVLNGLRLCQPAGYDGQTLVLACAEADLLDVQIACEGAMESPVKFVPMFTMSEQDVCHE